MILANVHTYLSFMFIIIIILRSKRASLISFKSFANATNIETNSLGVQRNYFYLDQDLLL
jgi:hypothetical protein